MRGAVIDLGGQRDERRSRHAVDEPGVEHRHDVGRLQGHGLIAGALPELDHFRVAGPDEEFELLQVLRCAHRLLGEVAHPAGVGPEEHDEAGLLHPLLERGLELGSDEVDLVE